MSGEVGEVLQLKVGEAAALTCRLRHRLLLLLLLPPRNLNESFKVTRAHRQHQRPPFPERSPPIASTVEVSATTTTTTTVIPTATTAAVKDNGDDDLHHEKTVPEAVVAPVAPPLNSINFSRSSFNKNSNRHNINNNIDTTLDLADLDRLHLHR
jgi:hypothetical protein